VDRRREVKRTRLQGRRKALQLGIMIELKIRKFGKSLGVVLPKKVIRRLQARDGERLFLIEAADSDYRLTSYDPTFRKKLKRAEAIMGRYRNTLHALAE
jgi:antitoxin component of MazEF toxin-antitoxin module